MELMKKTIPERSISIDYRSIVAKLLRRRAFSFRQLDVKNMLSVVKAILLSGNSTVADSVSVDKATAEIIRKLSCKFACDCSTKNIQEIVEEIVGNKYLFNYDLDAMMVVALAAYAVNYSKYRIFVESCATNDLLYKNILMLQQVLEIEYSRKLLGAIDKVMVATAEMIDFAIKLVGLRRATSAQILTTPASVDHVAVAVCYTIHAVVLCASLHTGFVVQDVESVLLNFTNGFIKTTTEALHSEYEAISRHQNEWQEIEDVLCYTVGASIEAVLRVLINSNGKLTHVIDNNSGTEVSFGDIKGQNVCLLISGGYISKNEINGIAAIVKETKHQLIWLPISIEPKTFKETQCLVNWYTVGDPSHVRSTAIRFIQKTWSFKEQTILVPLGQKELQVYPIDWLWSRRRFPVDGFEVLPLPQLSLNYLLADIYQLKISPSKPSSPPIVCLYGGEDYNWIVSFTKLLRDVGSKCQVDMDFVYVSQSEGIDSENTAIFNLLESQKSGSYWRASGSECWRFWTRVESFYREQTRVESGTNTTILKEALALLSYNANTKGWVIFGQFGTDFKLAHATGKAAEVALKVNHALYRKANSTAFIEELCEAFNEQVKKQASHCSHIMLPASVGDLGNCITCPICDKTMTKYSFYRCCT